MKILDVDTYLEEGCGRCAHFQTPACKVHRWSDELRALRDLVRSSGLVEEVKWGSPCYTLAGKNVVMIVAFKEHCALSFFKGAALEDAEGVLESPGPNSRFGRLLKFHSLDEFEQLRTSARRLIEQAIALERAGTKVVPAAGPEALPLELEQRLAADAAVARAFAALTPGRRRSHILHVAGAKQGETRARRAERCVQDILSGRGFNER